MNNVFLLSALILLCAFFEGVEIAFVTANKIKIEIKARKKNFAAINALYFINNPQIFFSSVLIGNTVVLIAFGSIFSISLDQFKLSEFAILIISTSIILIFGELLPKYIFRETADRIILISSIPLRIFTLILYPVIKIFSSVANMFSKDSELKEGNINHLFSKEDIEHLVKESHEAGAVNKSESNIISKVFALGDQRVYEPMQPRTNIIGVEINTTKEEVVECFIESGYSKLPVYEENLDNIKGVIFAYDLFTEPKDIQSIIRDVIFVPETKRSIDMLNEFLEKKVSIAIVIDEFGGTAGLVTLEDIMEELFGEIEDEFDIEEDIYKELKPNTYLISGKVEIDFINEKFKLDIQTGDYETISGFIIYRIGRIPKQGEKIKLDHYNILIVRASQMKIELVKIERIQDAE
ncbi:MAG: hemolysin family protein [Bacteroidota bacterium]|nr:hemolysin family protein [Bacteroidota bacterium]